MKHAIGIGLISLFGLLAGCATPLSMDIKRDTPQIDVSKKSLLLMSAEITNEYKPGFQPNPRIVYFEKPVVNGSEDRLNFIVDDQAAVKNGSGDRYLFRMQVEPGEYVIRGVGSFARRFPIMASFFMPMHSTVTVPPNAVVYLGRVSGKVRERNEAANEFRAGAPIPLVDQGVAGASGGTFDVVIADAEAEDIPSFRAQFPVLNSQTIVKQVMPAFNRQVAQQWWQDN